MNDNRTTETTRRTADEAIEQTKADLNRSVREDQLVAEIERLRMRLLHLDAMIHGDFS